MRPRDVAIAGVVALALAAAVEGVRSAAVGTWRLVSGQRHIIATADPPPASQADTEGRAGAGADAAVEMYASALALERACPRWRVNDAAVAYTFSAIGVSIDDLRPGGRLNEKFEHGGAEARAVAGFGRDPACQAAAKFGESGWMLRN